MALKIKQHENLFLVEGTINSTTVKQFKNHLEFLLLYSKSLTINIDAVNSIDTNGVKAFKDLLSTALTYNKKFSIIGFGAKDIYDDFQFNYAA